MTSTFRFTVYGRTLAEIRAAAEQELERFEPEGTWTYTIDATTATFGHDAHGYEADIVAQPPRTPR